MRIGIKLSFSGPMLRARGVVKLPRTPGDERAESTWVDAIAGIALLLVTDQAAGITGRLLFVDCGLP